MRIHLLRHGKTNFNTIYKDFIKKYSIQPHEHHFCDILNYLPSKELIDSPINTIGKKKILENKKINKNKIKKTKLVIISPLRRALETAEIFYKGEKNVKKIVHPGLRANLNSMYDIPIFCEEKIERFKDFDFGFLRKGVLKHGFEWFLYDLGNVYRRDMALRFLERFQEIKGFEENREIKGFGGIEDFEDFAHFGKNEHHLKKGFNFESLENYKNLNKSNNFRYSENLKNFKNLKNQKKPTDIEKALELVKLMRDISPESLELPIDVNHRIFNFKKWLSEYIIENNYKEEEVTLIGHDVFFKYFVAKEFKKDGYPVNCPQIDNSELVEFDLEI